MFLLTNFTVLRKKKKVEDSDERIGGNKESRRFRATLYDSNLERDEISSSNH